MADWPYLQQRAWPASPGKTPSHNNTIILSTALSLTLRESLEMLTVQSKQTNVFSMGCQCCERHTQTPLPPLSSAGLHSRWQRETFCSMKEVLTCIILCLGGRDAHFQIFNRPLSPARHVKEERELATREKSRNGVEKESKKVEQESKKGRKRVLVEILTEEHVTIWNARNGQSNFCLSLDLQTRPLNALP